MNWWWWWWWYLFVARAAKSGLISSAEKNRSCAFTHVAKRSHFSVSFSFGSINQSILISLLFHSSYLCLGNDIVFFTGETKLVQRWWWWIQQVQKQIRLESSIELTNLKANFTYYKKKEKKERKLELKYMFVARWMGGAVGVGWRKREREREQWMKGDKLILLWFWDSRKNRGETNARENTVCVVLLWSPLTRCSVFYVLLALFRL